MMKEQEEEAARDLFLMPGWEALIDDVNQQIEMCNLDACDSAEDLWFNKGRLAALRILANYESYVRSIGEQDEADYELQ